MIYMKAVWEDEQNWLTVELINVDLVEHFISFSYIKESLHDYVLFLCNSHFKNNGISV